MSEQVEVKKAVCFFCHSRCSVEVTLRDGRIEKMEENKEHPLADTRFRPLVRACPRARAVADFANHPDRLCFPLKRVGERGEGKWQQISWEQAWDEISAKLSAIKEEYGAEAIGNTIGTGRTDEWPKVRFFNLLGSPNYSFGAGQICYTPAVLTSTCMYGFSDSPLPSRSTRCMMLWGTNPQQSSRHTWLRMLHQLRAGAKLIVVDPRRTPAAERADIWLQLRPGSDCALAMSMINVIISEELYDKDFVARWCYGFDKLAERAQDYPPEKVAEITWVPAEKIREAARMYATTKPSVILHMMGIEHLSNSIDALQARYILAAVTGNLDVRGGEEYYVGAYPGLRTEHELELDDKISPKQRKKEIGADRFKLISRQDYLAPLNERLRNNEMPAYMAASHAPLAYRAMITGRPYPIRACITVSSNPLVTQPNTKLVYKALKSLDLYVVHDHWMTPSAEIADYVTPAASWLERPQFFTAYDTTQFIDAGEAVIPAKVEGEYDRKNEFDFWRGLGIRMGQEEFWPWKTLEEACSYRLEPMGYTFKQFLKETGGRVSLSKEERKYERIGFRTPTGKVELYSTVMEKLGLDPLPRYAEPAESPISTPELAKEYPLILITGGRHQPFFHSEFRQIDSLRKQHPNPIVQIHPSKASELGINDGDWVWIETPRGRVRQVCRHFEGMDPRVVHAQHGWWFPELPGEEPWLHGVWESNINVVTEDDPDHCNKKSGGWPLRALLCKVYKVKSY